MGSQSQWKLFILLKVTQTTMFFLSEFEYLPKKTTINSLRLHKYHTFISVNKIQFADSKKNKTKLISH